MNAPPLASGRKQKRCIPHTLRTLTCTQKVRSVSCACIRFSYWREFSRCVCVCVYFGAGFSHPKWIVHQVQRGSTWLIFEVTGGCVQHSVQLSCRESKEKENNTTVNNRWNYVKITRQVGAMFTGVNRVVWSGLCSCQRCMCVSVCVVLLLWLVKRRRKPSQQRAEWQVR
jgi:hypothetical protein